jgi:hypothetical protein
MSLKDNLFAMAARISAEINLVRSEIAAGANDYVLPFADNSEDWNAAFAWGEHSLAGYSLNDTTYTIGDGGLTEKNFTLTLKNKLDGIAANANRYTHPATHSIAEVSGLQTRLDNIAAILSSDNSTLDEMQEVVNFIVANKATLDALGISNIAGLVSALAGKANSSQVLTNVPAGAKFTDTNTTYGVGDGGLTTKNFTQALFDKLNGLLASAGYMKTSTTAADNLHIRNGAPTVYLRDTNNAGAAIHVNGNLFYVLNMGVDQASWGGALSGGWPMTLNLVNGNMNIAGTFLSAGNSGAYSDVRLKSEIEKIESGLFKVNQMRGVHYIKDGKFDTGVIAQEMGLVAPEIVWRNELEEEDELFEEMDGYIMAVDYGRITAYLIEGVNELSAIKDGQAETIADLLVRVSALENAS